MVNYISLNRHLGHVFCILISAACLTIAPLTLSHGAPFIPIDDNHVLEQLPKLAVTFNRDIRQLQQQLKNDPLALDAAIKLARTFITLGRAQGDPRYEGYAHAALRPWWNQVEPPPEVLLLRAILRQRSHDFNAALIDISRVLHLQPRNAQALLTKATILLVRGEYTKALRSCLATTGLINSLTTTTCTANVASINGHAKQSYQLLSQALNDDSSASAQERQWSLITLANIAARQGQTENATHYFEQAFNLGNTDTQLLRSFSDFLLDQNQPIAVKRLLEKHQGPDVLLIRLALAEQRLDSPLLKSHIEELQSRFSASRARNNPLHMDDEARFTLHFLNQPKQALQLALNNWQTQREPKDAHLVLEAAVAANDPTSAEPILQWLTTTQLEDINITRLAQKIKEMQL